MSTTMLPARCSRFFSAIRRCKTSSRSSAWTNCRKRISRSSRGRGRSNASCRSPSTSPPCSPARPACRSKSRTPSRVSRASSKASTIICPRPRSTWSARSSRPSRRPRSWRPRLNQNRVRGRLMPTTFHFELVSPDKVLFNGSAQAVLVPGSEGDFQVLSDHAPVMTSMRPGVVGIDDEQGKHTRVFVRGGFADASKAGLIVLAETAIPFEDFSADKLAEQIKNAEEDLADAKDDQKPLAQEKLDRLRELKDVIKL